MTKFIALDQIIIKEDRQRREFSPQAMAELAESIEKYGLFNPVVLRAEGDKLILVAGERRVRACRDLHLLDCPIRHDAATVPTGSIPYVLQGEIGELEAEEIELEENIRREDLSWQDRVRALARLEAIKKKLSAANGKPAPTLAEFAAETFTAKRDGQASGPSKYGIEATRQQLAVAQHLDDPEIQKAKTVEEAFKVIEKREQTAKYSRMAEAFGKTFSAADHKVINSDCIEWLRGSESSLFDVVLTDPPYGMGADSFGSGAGKLDSFDHTYDDSYESWKELVTELAQELFKITKREAHAYIFCDFDRFHELKRAMENAGWYVFRTPLIDHKVNSGRVPLPEMGPRRSYETILYAIKGKKSVTAIYPDVIPVQMKDETFGHGAQKPVELFVNLLKRSCRPGDKVLDCFAGTGTILPAAHELKVAATAIELDPANYGICLKRLEALK